MKKILILSVLSLCLFGCSKEKDNNEDIVPVADFTYTIGTEYKNCEDCYPYYEVFIFNTSKDAKFFKCIFYNLDYPDANPLESIDIYEQHAGFYLDYDSYNYLVCFIAYNGTKSDSIYKEIHISK